LRVSGRPYEGYTVELSTFERWKRKWFSGFQNEQQPIPGQGAEADDDADGDGISNRREYAQGSNPLKADNKPGLRLGRRAAKDQEERSTPTKPYDMEVVYERSKYAQDAALILETSADLTQWRRDGYHVSETIITDNDDGLTQTVRVRIKVQGKTRGFARLLLDQE
jgi:hypothetical protein